jgi:RNA recognition motif-containing protein
MNIFVGNLSFETTEAELKQLFETMGEVSSAVIVMEKEKKAPKSRGFGFVEMPDEAQALAAISALNGRDFMGRLLNVNPTRPKTETQRKNELEKKAFLKAKAKRMQAEQNHHESRAENNPDRLFIPKPGTYKGGRRTRSYVMRTGTPVDMRKGTKPWLKSLENPMRWRKPGQVKPWERNESNPQEIKPWQKSAGGAKPWQRSSKGRKPWEKTGGASQGVKPWKKPESFSAKPWQGGSSGRKPWQKEEGAATEPMPWKKATGSSKPWIKKSERSQGLKYKTRSRRPKIIVDKG